MGWEDMNSQKTWTAGPAVYLLNVSGMLGFSRRTDLLTGDIFDGHQSVLPCFFFPQEEVAKIESDRGFKAGGNLLNF